MAKAERTNEVVDRLISEAEAAALLGLAPITLRRQRCTGQVPGQLIEIPYIKLGDRCVRYSLNDIQAIIADRRVGAAR